MDLVMLGGTILTMDGMNRRHEALAVRNCKIAAVGATEEISKLVGQDTQVVHLAGRTVVPGFIDPHNHFSMTTFEPVSVDCRMPPLDGKQDVLDAIASTARGTSRGQWIWGVGFDASNNPDVTRLTRGELDEAAADNPVCIMDWSYHACYANSIALRLAGIDRNTPDPHKGWILKDDRGEPDGTLWERAMDPVHKVTLRAHVDHYEEDVLAELVHRNARRHLAAGITSLGDAQVMPESAELYRVADRLGKLPIVVHQMRGGERFFAVPELASKGQYLEDDVSDRLRGGTMKVFMDPVYPGPAMLRQYAHGECVRLGQIYYTQDEVDALVMDATQRGLQVAIHCIGNWAIEQGLNAFESAMRKADGSADLRPRIEHFSFPTYDQIERAASLGVIVSQQPAFLYTLGEHGDAVVDVMDLGTPYAPLRTMLDSGVETVAGSDFPCAPLAPLTGIYSMVSRTARVDGRKIAPEEAITPTEAFKMYTATAARAIFREAEVGSLEQGKRADMVVLSHDPTTVAADNIREISVQRTYVDGQLLYEGQ